MKLPEIEEFYNEIGSLIKTERLQRHISQEQLSNILDLTRASIINIENGRHRPSVYQLLLISSFLKIEINKLLPRVAAEQKNVSDISILEEGITEEGKIDESTKMAVGKFLADL